MIHEGIQLVIEGFVILAGYVDWLDRAVKVITVERLELQQSPIIRRTAVGVPGGLT